MAVCFVFIPIVVFEIILSETDHYGSQGSGLFDLLYSWLMSCCSRLA